MNTKTVNKKQETDEARQRLRVLGLSPETVENAAPKVARVLAASIDALFEQYPLSHEGRRAFFDILSEKISPPEAEAETSCSNTARRLRNEGAAIEGVVGMICVELANDLLDSVGQVPLR